MLTVGEIRKGIENIRRRDRRAALALERWLRRLMAEHRDRILVIDLEIAEEWGRLNVPNPLPIVDGLLAADSEGPRADAGNTQCEGRGQNRRSTAESLRSLIACGTSRVASAVSPRARRALR